MLSFFLVSEKVSKYDGSFGDAKELKFMLWLAQNA